MNIKKIIKAIVLIGIIFGIIFYSKPVSAATTLGSMTKQAKSFISRGAENQDKISYDKITDEFAALGQILTTVGAGVMVAVVTYMGIKYLTAGPEAQAKLKVQLIGIVVSGVVIFGSYTIWKIVVQVAETF